MRWVRRVEILNSQDIHSQIGNLQMGGRSQLQRFPQGARSPSLMWHSPAERFYTRNRSSQNSRLWRPQGLPWRRQRALGNRFQSFFLFFNGTKKIPHTSSPNIEAIIWKKHGSDMLTNFGDPSRKAGSTEISSLENREAGSSHFEKLILPRGHWCLQVKFWSCPSSHLVLGAASISSGSPQ